MLQNGGEPLLRFSLLQVRKAALLPSAMGHDSSQTSSGEGPGLIHRAAHRLEKVMSRLTGNRTPDERAIVRCFHGYGAGNEAVLRGRAEVKREFRDSSPEDSKRRNFLNMAANFFTKELPGVTIEGSVDGERFTTVCDEEGYFRHHFSSDQPLSKSPTLEYSAQVVLPGHSDKTESATTRGTLSVLDSSAKNLIISDVDDTVIETGAAKLWQLLRNTLLENEHTRKLFPGVSKFYQQLSAGSTGEENNPLFYVTSSPWNLREFLLRIFELRGIPRGPLFMTDWGLDEHKWLKAGHEEHKLAAIRHLLDFHGSVPAILIGDSGEKDPEIYSRIVEDYPGRVTAIFIRDVSASARDEEVAALAKLCKARGVPLHLVADTAAAVLQARALSLIGPA